VSTRAATAIPARAVSLFFLIVPRFFSGVGSKRSESPEALSKVNNRKFEFRGSAVAID
jgi:hypothetical protein